MKRYLVGGGILASLAILALFLSPKEEKQEAITTSPEKYPTVEVTEGEVSLRKGDEERLVLSGEEVEAPFTLRSNAGGAAIVHLPEGSELRLDENSTLYVEEAAYHSETKDLVVNVKLSVGKVWSSIVALTTPASSWEVETSNVVGTVRGTAFGVEVHANGDTTVTGSQHNIELTLINPDTKTRDEKRKIFLNEDESVVISLATSRSTTGEVPPTQKKGEKEENDGWVKKNEGRDRTLLPQDKKDDQEDTKTPEGEIRVETELDSSPLPSPATPTQSKPTLPSLDTPTKPNSSSGSLPKPVSVRVTPIKPLSGIVEGTTVDITATLIHNDGSTKDVSREVGWGVVGDIGSMRGSLFSPQLGPNVSEMGRAVGSIGATWKDRETGAELYGATEIFEVKAKVIPLGTEEG